MMGGEIDYREVFLENKSSVYIMQCVFLVLFFLVMSIVVMNVFVGLAVGDTDEMMNKSKAENRRCKVSVKITNISILMRAH
jgi:Na+-transporting methylmalonyl-CoA/oxaloacetate decarboxylase gamma subunit